MTGQAVRGVNCPHCGEITKVICPDSDKQPKRIKVSVKLSDLGWNWMPSACVHCKCKFSVLWEY